MADVEKLHEFITDYFERKEGGLIERRSFTRFKTAMPDTMDAETVKTAYTQYTGNTPYYHKDNNYSAYKLKVYASRCYDMADALTHDPMSFTDLYNTALQRPSSFSAPYDTDMMRKCFKAASEQGVIGCMEVRTCGKCHIRLYYLND